MVDKRILKNYTVEKFGVCFY